MKVFEEASIDHEQHSCGSSHGSEKREGTTQPATDRKKEHTVP
jgi:hypothetical protein